MDDSEDSEGSEVTRRIKEIRDRTAAGDDDTEDEDEIEVEVTLSNPTGRGGKAIKLLANTRIEKTILNERDWRRMSRDGELRETGRRFRPYGTGKLLPIIGKAQDQMTAGAGAEIQTEIYVIEGKK